jgi:hypothetical protein
MRYFDQAYIFDIFLFRNARIGERFSETAERATGSKDQNYDTR